MQKISKKDLKKKIGTLAIASTLIFSSSINVFAHGWIINDRAHLGSNRGGNRNTGMGAVRYEPQSVGEGGRFRVENGNTTLNHAIGGAAGAFGAMRQYGANRWHRTRMPGGTTNLQWVFTQAHRTSHIHYYVSNPDFDHTRPLSYSDFTRVASFNYNGNRPAANNTVHTHTINLPTDRRGPGAILAAWHVSDAAVSWYRIIDVYFTGDGTAVVTPPTTPTNPPVTTTPTNPPASGGTTTPANGPRIWEANISFAAGDRAIHNNLQWHARVASQGVTPGTNNAIWQMMGAAPAMPVNPPANNNNAPSNTDVPTWTNAASFNAGDIVRHNNLRWR
ncbi:MAG: lytic polysaccharide monooxygenase, partial [Defluviitaleaceae bacterium]|nr:lytic polysaccharide monooxygenase [Defluviitaleaceae bacterium]